jgi:hypothetical protein
MNIQHAWEKLNVNKTFLTEKSWRKLENHAEVHVRGKWCNVWSTQDTGQWLDLVKAVVKQKFYKSREYTII